MSFNRGDQVIYKQRTAGNVNVIRVGEVVALADDGRVVVNFNAPQGQRSLSTTRKTVAEDELTPVSKRFGGRTRVQVDPLRRHIG